MTSEINVLYAWRQHCIQDYMNVVILYVKYAESRSR